MSVLQSSGAFLKSCETYQEAAAIIFGVPMDYTVSFRPGTRTGPQGIRTASYGLEEYSVHLDRYLSDVKFHDLGDIVLPFGNVTESMRLIQEITLKVVREGRLPLILGGEHLITYPIVQAVKSAYPELAVVHFDAHADLRDTYYGEKLSHGTVLRRVSEVVGPESVYQFGIRSGVREEFEFARENTHLHKFKVREPFEKELDSLQGRPVFVTLDIDVIDPAYAPGTGTPEPGGISAEEMIEVIHLLSGLRVVGMDLVEVSPAMDFSGETCLLAAKLVREALLAFVWRGTAD
ncbi:MAG: agmatinase [Actinobacteria bacterium]|nr:agmatinase [Actinomycetota bacterium]